MTELKSDIQFFNQTDLSLPISERLFQTLANHLASEEQGSFNFVEIVYVGEEKIVEINKEHLDRDYVTDIITFRYDERDDNQDIEGTLFCCAPRIQEQAEEFGESTEKEFARIFIHGLLHLMGYEDQSAKNKKQMTAKEDLYLQFFDDLLS